MMTPGDRDDILRWLDVNDVAALAAANPSSVGAVLLEMMETNERRSPDLDEDRLARNARGFRFSGFGNMDEAVIAWLRERPSAARIDVASVVLQYFWFQALGARDVDPSLVEALFDARTRVPLTPEADASSLFALVRALEAPLPAELRERLLNLFAEAVKRPHQNPAVQPVLSQTLAKAGRST